jgi:hypothetical protein
MSDIGRLVAELESLKRRVAHLETLDRGRKNNFAATAAPGVTNDLDQGYGVGSIWINVTADNAYICEDASDGAAVWAQID